MSANNIHPNSPRLGPRPSLPWRIGSSVVIGATGALSRAFLYGFNDVEVFGLPGFLDILDKRNKVSQRERGLVTVCNHISIVDDPLIWGVLPLRYTVDPYNHRWSLGAHDLCFSNRFLSTFFSLGQVLPTHRMLHSTHGGLFQPTITQAIHLLSSQPFTQASYLPQPDPAPHDGHFTTNGTDLFPSPSQEPDRRHSWVHVFPEGFVHQHRSLDMRYFKWGIARMILESEPGPELVPIFVDGTQKIMPEKRKFPRFLPRVGNKITVAFGDGIDTESAFGDLRRRWKELVSKHQGEIKRVDGKLIGCDDNLPDELKYGPDAIALRMEATKRVRSEVTNLRKRLGYPDGDPSYALAETWARDGNEPKYTSQVDGSLVRKR